MAQAGISLTKLYWNRFCSTRLILFLFLQKTLFAFFRVMLLIPLFILSTGSVLRAQGRATSISSSSSSSSSATQQTDLPDAPSAPPVPPVNPQPSIPFMSQRFGPPGPMDVEDKFKYFIEPSFGPRALLTNALSSGIRMANPPSNYPHDWRAGGEAFGRLYGDSFARSGAESIGRFSASVLLHEDPRYRRSESTFFPTRLGHALVFTFVDKTDGGHNTVAISNFTGAAAGGFIGNAYLPSGFDNLTHAGQRSAVVFGGMAAQNVLQEFSPEIGQFLKKIHLPHIPLPPEWWTGDK